MTANRLRELVGRKVVQGPVCIACALAVSWLAAASASAQPARQAVERFRGVGMDQHLGAQLPLDVELVTETGDRVPLRSLLRGRPVILNLIYFRCPMLCNLASDALMRSLRGLSLTAGRDFSVWTVSFDATEKPPLAAAAKRTAMTRYGHPEASGDWHFLTGSAASIERLTTAVGFSFKRDADTGQLIHTSGLVILTPDGKVSRYLLGVEYAPRDVRLSLVEASQGKIGTFTDQVLLYCYHYDPATGKYGLLIQNVIRLAGGLTVVILGLAIGSMLLRERRRSRSESGESGAGHSASSETLLPRQEKSVETTGQESR